MPGISEFLGLLIDIKFKDHAPEHFHVLKSQERVASVDIKKLEDWKLAQSEIPQKLKKIPPLKK